MLENPCEAIINVGGVGVQKISMVMVMGYGRVAVKFGI